MFTDHHPSIEQYIPYFKRAMNLVTQEVIQQLLPKNYIIDNFTPIDSSQGVINKIYMITLQNFNKKILLRVSNTHPFWQTFAKDNHLHCLKILHQYHLPGPELLCEGKYVDPNDASLFFEYLIFVVNDELISLQTYKEKTYYFSFEERIQNQKIFIQQGVEILAKMQHIQVPQLIGSFTRQENLIGIINDGPRIGPFNSVKDYMLELLQWSLKEFQFINNSIKSMDPINDEQFLFDKYGYIDNRTINQLKLLEYQIVNSEIQVLEQTHEIFFCHNDFNPSNILIDSKTLKIISLIDWDQASLSPTRCDIEKIILEWTDYGTIESLQEYYKELLIKYNIKQGNKELQKIESLLNSAKWACFWVNQWFASHPEEDIPQLIIQERKNNLIELKQKLKEFFNICQI